MAEETCLFCGRGLPPEQYAEARSLIEDFLIEWEAHAHGELIEQVAGAMRDWLDKQPPLPNIQASANA